ncbi:sodium hydrogen exchanger 8 [Pelobates cultripes]|uniref:Sodium hydrogen exchanger 8 n=1 Tax=Pelobates cultripes TaxID=61616 RepID=A0AAD1SKG1_PELCU|nr:sodium hydrogen exchanger 8 [Pelobates cultripes]
MAEAEFHNDTNGDFNSTLFTTLTVATKLVLPTLAKPIIPVQTGVQAQQEEQSSGMSIFFSLLVLAICIILVHLLIKFRLHFLPESVAVVSLGWGPTWSVIKAAIHTPMGTLISQRLQEIEDLWTWGTDPLQSLGLKLWGQMTLRTTISSRT